MFLAVNKYYPMFEYSSDKLKDDKEVVLKLVSKHAKIAKLISKRLKDDEEVCKVSILNHAHSIRFFSKRLRNIADIMLLAIENSNENVFKYAGKDLAEKINKESPSSSLKSYILSNQLVDELPIEIKTVRKNKI